MPDIEITAETREKALQEATHRLRLPEEALECQWDEEQDDLLAGARPLVLLRVTIRLDYVAGQVCECLCGLLERMLFDEAEVKSECDCRMVLADIACDQQELLIGYHGETLDALQHLVVRITGLSGRDMPLILVDAGGYRAERINRLKRVARELAESAKKSGEEEPFDPMDSIDRKIVHTILRDIEGVHTVSRGEDYNRHVIVVPEN